MENKNTRAEKLEIIFANHPDENEVFMASDDKAFFTEHQADAYAQRLPDRKVQKFTRNIVAAFVSGKSKVESKESATQESGDGKSENEKEASEVDATDTAAPEGESEKGLEKETSTKDGDTQEEAEESASDESEREALAARYEELLGRKPVWNMKLEKLKAAVEEAEAK